MAEALKSEPYLSVRVEQQKFHVPGTHLMG